VAFVLTFPTIRLSEVVSDDPKSTEMLVFPTQAMIYENLASGMLCHLVGFELNYSNGTGCLLNFILSNGNKTHQRDVGRTYSTHVMPKDANKRIRSVDI
jgi:hypothetical protein